MAVEAARVIHHRLPSRTINRNISVPEIPVDQHRRDLPPTGLHGPDQTRNHLPQDLVAQLLQLPVRSLDSQLSLHSISHAAGEELLPGIAPCGVDGMFPREGGGVVAEPAVGGGGRRVEGGDEGDQLGNAGELVVHVAKLGQEECAVGIIGAGPVGDSFRNMVWDHKREFLGAFVFTVGDLLGSRGSVDL